MKLWIVLMPTGALFVRASTGACAWRTRNDAIQRASAVHGDWKALRRKGWRADWVASGL